jgi:hypothetical protein
VLSVCNLSFGLLCVTTLVLREAKKANKAMQKMEAKNIAAKENVIVR